MDRILRGLFLLTIAFFNWVFGISIADSYFKESDKIISVFLLIGAVFVLAIAIVLTLVIAYVVGENVENDN